MKTITKPVAKDPPPRLPVKSPPITKATTTTKQKETA